MSTRQTVAQLIFWTRRIAAEYPHFGQAILAGRVTVEEVVGVLVSVPQPRFEPPDEGDYDPKR